MKDCKLLIILFFILIPVPTASQQWKKIGQFEGKITSGYFFDSKSGIVSFIRAESPVIVWTTNGGLTWQESVLTPEISIFKGFLSSILMRDSLVGYASAYATSLPSYYKDGVWFTLNGGKNWFSNKDSSQWVSLTTLPNGKLVTSQGGIAFKDSLIGMQSIAAPAISRYPYQSMYITNDGAMTWQQIPNVPNQSSECWGLCYSNVFDAFYIASEMGSTVTFEINRTTNLGNTWNRISTLPAPTGTLGSTGDIQCYDSSIYVQTIGSGMYRSRDGGITWKNIGGPSNDYDTRFCVPPSCKGNLVVAFSKEGEVWITENGGDGELNPAPQIDIIPIQNFKNVSSCDKDTAVVILKYRGCGTILLDSLNLRNSVRSLFSIEITDTNNRFLEDSHSDTIFIIFQPNGNVGSFTTYLFLKANVGIDKYSRLLDTAITLIAKSTPIPPRLVVSELQNNLGSYSLCKGRTDTTITLRNFGCDTLCITQGPGTLPPEFTMGTLSYPFCLPPDSNLTLPVTFIPSAVGTFRAYPRFRAEQQGLWQDVEFELVGTGTEGDGEFRYEPKQFDLKTLSICSRDSASGYITNFGCDTLSLTDASLFASGDYTISPLPPTFILPGDTIGYTLYLNPQQKGTRSGYVVFTTSNRSGMRTDSVSITAAVTDGTRILSASVSSLDFGTTSLCDERDTTITLRNSGCDTLVISDAALLGAGFSTNVTLPIVIAPGASAEMQVTTRVDTSQGNTSTGAITFTTNADNQTPPIQLVRSYSKPKSFALHLAMPTTSATAGEIVRLAVVGERGLGRAGSGVKRIEFDLALNDDLLSYITAEGKNIVSKNDRHITITNAGELESIDDTIAVLRYHVYLTKDSATEITLSNLTLGGDDTSACAPRIAAQSDEQFRYLYQCGDKHIQSFLRTGKASLEITAIRPNPASNDVTVTIASSQKQTASLEIYDILGKKRSEMFITLSNQPSEVVIPIHELTEGQYIIRIATAISSSSAVFTKQVK